MAELLTNLNNNNGLTDRQVEESRKLHGSNRLQQVKGKSFFSKYLESFADPMIRILLVALGINLIFLFRTLDWYEPLGIGISIFIATLISTLSEHGSQAAFEKLQEEASKIKSKVMRGTVMKIPADDIVVGDIVILQSGDMVPADGYLVSGKIEVNQAALNGETKEARKQPSERGQKEGELTSAHMVFRGSVVVGGEAAMCVTRVGDATFYGSMAREVQSTQRESPMKVRLYKLANTISKIGYTGAVLVAVSYIFQILYSEYNFNFSKFASYYSSYKTILPEILNIVMLAVTVIVVSVPEGLPMMITVVLSANMKKMLSDNVLVRKMIGIETAGSMNMLFTDKTGTLTRGQLSVTCVISGSGNTYKSFNEIKQRRQFADLFYKSAFYNNSAYFAYGGGSGGAVGGNATDRALLGFISSSAALRGALPVVKKIPFDSNSKYSAARIGGSQPLTLYKGAPDRLLPFCTHYYNENGEKLPLDYAVANKISKLRVELERQAMRMLAMATSDTELGDTLSGGLCLLCIAGIRDELRPEAAASVKRLKQAGIDIVMVTGDSKETATAIARECGIISSDSDIVLTSKELAAMGDKEVISKIKKLRVVARALPSDKSRLVRLAQSIGLVVGMTGDGVNDAPALKAADVGFSMGSGSDVAKEASDIVILDDNIQSITKAVLYGRTIFKSIRKFVIYQLTVNLCAVGLSVIGPFLGVETPVTIMQMLWINLVMDTLGGLAFSGEPTRESYMNEKPKKREENILNRYMISQVLWTGIYSLTLSLLFLKLPFLSSYIRPHEKGLYFMTALFALFMFMAIFNSLNARTHKLNLSSYLSRNKPFLLIMGIVFIVQSLMIYVGGDVFRTAGLTAAEYLLTILLAATVIPVDMIRKLFLKRAGKLNGV